MRNKTSVFKRSLAALLSFVMILGMFPVLGGSNIALEAEAAPVDLPGYPVSDYITLPITIRDFAADGMLFEYNEVDSSDTKTIGGTTTTYACEVNPMYWGLGQYTGDYTGIRVVVPNDYYDVFDDTYAAGFSGVGWYCVICDSDGNVLTVLDRSAEKKESGIYENAMTTYSGAYSVWAWVNSNDDHSNYAVLEAITEENKGEYRLALTNANTGNWDSSYAFASTLTVTSGMQVFHQADTKGFGLMLTGDNDRIKALPLTATADENGVIIDTNGPGTYISNGTYGVSTVPDPIDIVLNSGATQKGYGITIRSDLVESTLVNGKPAYTKETVVYLANYMSQIMNEPWQNADGSYNSFFVMGTKLFDADGIYVGPDDPTAELDLAAMLRQFVTNGLGDYDSTMAKAASLTDISKCRTWFDAAYYLLHYTWQDSPMESGTGSGTDGYGKYVPQYDSLHLVAKTNADGSVYYVFNSGYNYTAYDPVKKEIFNTQTEEVTAAQDSKGDFYTRGIKLPAARFDPLGLSGTSSTSNDSWLGYGENAGGNTYGDLVGSSATQLWADYYDTTNYHLSLEGHAEFIFRYDSDLYFTFTGDDDVYLYINGIRVLDLGAAHSIVKAQINLNDVAELCQLKEGEPARFDFFYLERHGTAANFGIETNIQLAQSGMITTKQGYQNGVSTGYDGPVDPSKVVAYSFTMKNAGDATLEHLTFTDEKLGVSLSEYAINWGTKIEGTGKDENGNPTLIGKGPIESMYLYVRDENDAIVRFYSATTETPLSEAVLMKELETGLPTGYSMTIYNFRYKITDQDWETGENTFTNIVNTTAIANGKQVVGAADWKVHKQELNAEPFHVYNWVNKDLDDTEWQSREVSLTKAELVQPVLDAANKNGDTELINKTNSSADIVLCNASGNTNSNLWSEDYTNVINNVTLADDDSITYTSKAPGMVTIYYKIENIGYDDYVFHFDVITYGVADNVYVLDYGLNVELNKEYGFRENDHLSVPQNIHESKIKMTMDIRQQGDEDLRWGNFVTETGETRDLDYDKSVEYQPTDIIDGCDSMVATIHFRETPPEDVTITDTNLKFYGVDMQQTVSTAPANVVYYEENHPGITYVNTDENNWVHYETMQPVMEQAKDLNGNPIVDENGNPVMTPVMEQAKDENGNPVWKQAVDSEGNPRFDDNNNPIFEQAVDSEGNLLFDDDNNPIYVPVMVVKYESVAGTNQSANQNSNYGSDPNYEKDKTGEYDESEITNVTTLKMDTDDMKAVQAAGIQFLNNYLGLGVGGSDSNGTINELYVKETAEVMFFDFTGTGFEIISRTTEGQYAVIDVEVWTKDADGNYTVLKTYRPVITESKGGDLYQVPIISIKGLPKDEYRVTVTAVGSNYNEETGTGKIRVLYIDGVRIYGPLGVDEDGNDKALDYYNPEEYEAEFHKVKQLIKDGSMIFADYSWDPEEDDPVAPEVEPLLVTGSTMVEDTSRMGGVLVNIDDVDQYMQIGPNNELYLTADTNSLIAFLLSPDDDYNDEERTLEIGAHRKTDSNTEETGYVMMTYGDTADSFISGENAHKIASGTEMYYTIDVSKLEPISEGAYKGKYLVIIGACEVEDYQQVTLALTNIKVKGYDISFVEKDVRTANDEGNLNDMPVVQETFALLKARANIAPEEPEVDKTPVNENLTIASAKLKAEKVISGKTATVTVKAGADAEDIVLTDTDGNEVELAKVVRMVSGGVATFTVTWKVSGTRGEKQTFAIRVFDVGDFASVNTESVTVTFK